MPPTCSHILPALICLVSHDTTSKCAISASASRSGGEGPTAWTSPADQQPVDFKGSRIGQYWHWGPLRIWDLDPGSMSKPPPSPISNPDLREGCIRQWAGSILCRQGPRSSPHLDLGRASTICSSPGVDAIWPGEPPPSRQKPFSWSPERTPRHIPTCCNNKPGWWSWSQS